MIIHNINPTIARIGPLEIRWYGVIFALGFLLVWYFLKKYGSHLEWTEKQTDDYLFWLMVGVVAGSRLFEVFVWSPAYYLADPIRILYIWQGGLAFHGGLIGAMAITWWFAHRYGTQFGRIADVVAIPAAFGLALGRIGNFINGEIPGTLTSVPWCFVFPGYEGCRHPVVLYGAAGRTVLGGFLLWKMSRKHKDGFIFWLFVCLIGAGRFLIDFLREDPRWLGLSIGQYSSLAIFALGGIVLWKAYKDDCKRLFYL